MVGISDRIEAFIIELLKNEDDWLELKRNELASVFGCVPSQINYVMATRFGSDKGYIVESRRGGGGYLRIKRINTKDNNIIYNTIISIKGSIDYKSVESLMIYLTNLRAIDEKSARLILSAISDSALDTDEATKGRLRAGILKNMLTELSVLNGKDDK